MKKLILTLCGLIMVLSISASVTVTGAVGGNGTYGTLKAAFDAINSTTQTNASIIISVVSNTTETATAQLNNGAWISLTIKPAAGKSPAISGEVTNSLIKLNNASLVTIDGSNTVGGTSKDLTIENSSTTGSTIAIIEGSSNNIVKNLTIKGNSNDDIYANVMLQNTAAATQNCSNNTISNNTITKLTSRPKNTICLYGSSGKLITNTTISSNAISDFSQSGIRVTDYASNNTYTRNNFSQSSESSTSINGIQFANPNISSETISRNFMTDFNASNSYTVKGIDINSYSTTGTLTIVNNIINIGGNALSCYGIYDKSSNGTIINIYYNTIRIADTGPNSSSAVSACYYKANNPTVTIKNNILQMERTAGTAGFNYIYQLVATPSQSNFVSNYNNLKKPIETSKFAKVIGVTYATFATYRNATISGAKQDAQSLNTFPPFINTIYDFHINTNSAAAVDGTGTPISGVTEDFDGNTRNATNPDMGADEFDSSPAWQWIGTISNEWNDPLNWQDPYDGNTVPGDNDDVVIPTTLSVSVSSNQKCRNLTVSDGSDITVQAGNQLTVSGNFSNYGSITMLGSVSGNSSLIHNTQGVSATVQPYMPNASWKLISPPVTNQNVSSFVLPENTGIASSISGATTYYAFRSYNEAQNKWYSYFTGDTIPNYGSMKSAKGYTARRATAVNLPNPDQDYATYNGLLETTTRTIKITRNTGTKGWNCVGNPYAAPLSLNASADATHNFISVNANSLDPSFVGMYVLLTDSTFRPINNTNTSTYIPVGSGFFIKAKLGASQVIFTPEMRIHQSDINYRSASTAWTGFDLNVSSTRGKISTAIKMNSKMTDSLDLSYDAGLMRTNYSYTLYSRLVKDNGVDFSIQCVTDTITGEKVIPIGLDCSTNSALTFTVSSLTLPDNIVVTLEDRTKGVFTDLSAPNASYQVTVPANTTGTGRFFVHLAQNIANGVKNNNKTDASAFSVNAFDGGVNLFGNVGPNASAILFDGSGKMIAKFPLANSLQNRINTVGLSSGIYILQIQTNEGVVAKKFKI